MGLLELSKFLEINSVIAFDLISGIHENAALTINEWVGMNNKLRRCYLSALDLTEVPKNNLTSQNNNLPDSEITEPWRSQVADMFRKGNRILKSKFNLPLDIYDYPL